MKSASDNPDLKEQAARRALEYLDSGMLIGLGSGSTTDFFTDLLGEQLRLGRFKNIRAVPTSQKTAARARTVGIGLTSLSEAVKAHPGAPLDLTVDGADEVDPHFDLIKGLGRALLREKIIAVHTQQFIVIVDQSKLVSRLGIKGPLPVEIVTFEVEAHVSWLNSLGCRAELWLEQDGSPVTTDNGNYLALCHFEEGIPNSTELSHQLAERPGIIESGLFLGIARQVIVAGNEGVVVLGPGREQ